MSMQSKSPSYDYSLYLLPTEMMVSVDVEVILGEIAVTFVTSW